MDAKRENKGQNTEAEDKQSKDAYGKEKKDMGGYIGERSSAGDSDNPESLPGGA